MKKFRFPKPPDCPTQPARLRPNARTPEDLLAAIFPDRAQARQEGQETPSAYSWSMEEHGLTQSALVTFMTCPEKFRLSILEGLRSKRQGASAQFGNIVHKLLEDVFRMCFIEESMASDLPTIHKYVDGALTVKLREETETLRKRGSYYPEEEIDLATNYAMAHPVIKGYFEHYVEEDRLKDILQVERVFKVDRALKGNTARQFSMNGKVDREYRQLGQLWVLDTKTKGRIELEKIGSKLSFDMQVFTYDDAIAEIYEETPRGIIYDLVRRPQIERRKTEAAAAYRTRVEKDIASRPGFYYIRIQAIPSAADRALWKKEFDSVISQLYRWLDGKFHYKNPAACTGFGYTCEFLPICSGKPGWQNLYEKKVHPFPELHEDED